MGRGKRILTSLLKLFGARTGVDRSAAADPAMANFVRGYSIEVIPRIAAKVEDFRALLPAGTRVYIAHIDGTPIDDMVATAKRIRDEGFTPMPHFPARSIPDMATLADWVARYRGEAGVTEGLLLAGGATSTAGELTDSMQLMESGVFDREGFTRLHIAGHPEGNPEIDDTGGHHQLSQALRWKQDFSERTDAQMAITTQFCFDAGPVIAWADAIKAEGIDLPIHIGVAGPAKLQTMIKYAIACGVGPSLSVLQKRAADITTLLTPYEPTEFVHALATHKARHPDFGIEQVHLFPLGGISAATTWAETHGNTASAQAMPA